MCHKMVPHQQSAVLMNATDLLVGRSMKILVHENPAEPNGRMYAPLPDFRNTDGARLCG